MAEGRWLLRSRPEAPFRCVAVFTRKHPNHIPSHILKGYGTTDFNGEPIPRIPIFDRDINHEPPEATVVVVIGGAPEESGSGDGQTIGDQQIIARQRRATVAVQTIYSVEGANWFGLADDHPAYPDPNGPNYLGEYVPVVRYEMILPNWNSIDWVARRIFDFACYGIERWTVTAPLVFMRPLAEAGLRTGYTRKLRVGDPVLVEDMDGSIRTFIVQRVDPFWKKTHMQMATYHLATNSVIANATISGGRGGFAALRDPYDTKMIRKMRDMKLAKAIGGVVNQGGIFNQRQAGQYVNEILGAPTTPIPAIQYLDPEDLATYGNFKFMSGYDMVP